MLGYNNYIGFSDKINDPAIKAALKKNKTAAFIFFIIVLIAPIAVTFFIGMKDNDMKVVLGGAFVSLIILVVNIISFLNHALKTQWDGTVTKKYTESRHKSREDDRTYTYYVVELCTDSGKKKKISGTVNPYFDYLNIGDKVRYYPQFNNYYEKYDKSNDSYVFCPICMTKNNIEDDHCKRCKVPVIK